MKRLLQSLLLAATLLSTGLVSQAAPPPWAGGGRKQANATTASSDDLVALERFLTMDNSQLDKLLAALQKVRSLTPEQRSAMKKQIEEYRNLPVEQREQVRSGWGWQNETDRNDWPLMMREKSEQERAAIQAEIQALAPELKAVRKHALLEEWRQAHKQ